MAANGAGRVPGDHGSDSGSSGADAFLGFHSRGMAASPSSTVPVDLDSLAESISTSRSRYRGRLSDGNLPPATRLLPAGGRRCSAATATAATTSTTASVATSVAFQSILLHLCSFYETDPAMRDALFAELCAKIPAFKLVSPVFRQKELASLRSHYQHAFVRLIRMSQSKLRLESGIDAIRDLPLPNLKSLTHLNSRAEEAGLYHHSRYHTEFEELGFLAKGGFGSVFRAKNKLDGCEYAVKKIVLKYCDPDLFAKIFREVTTLAKLTHPNVVSYKTAWLEPGSGGSGSGNKKTTTTETETDDEEDEDGDDEERLLTSSAGDDDDAVRARLEEDTMSSGIVFNYEYSAREQVVDGHRRVSRNGFTKDATSRILHMEAAARVSASSSSKPKPIRKQMSKNVLSIKEMDEVDSFEEDVPRVVGMAATPPNAMKGAAFLKKRFEANTASSGAAGDAGSPGSKFWVGESDDDSSDGDDAELGNDVTGAVSKKVSFMKGNRRRRGPSLVAVNGGGGGGPSAAFDSLLAASPFEAAAAAVPDKAVLYLQMELCESTLRDWLDERNQSGCEGKGGWPAVSLPKNFDIFGQILSGVEYIHSQGIIHRDLKPRNIFLVRRSNEVKIGDFGLAKQELQSEVDTPETPEDVRKKMFADKELIRRTSSYHTSGVGTQAYGAPEQLLHGIIDEKSDVYSLGIILFELFHPFCTGMERSKAITELRKCRPPEEMRQRFPDMSDLVESMTSETPARRPTARELISAKFSGEAKERAAMRARIRDLERENEVQRVKLADREDVICRLREELRRLRS